MSINLLCRYSFGHRAKLRGGITRSYFSVSPIGYLKPPVSIAKGDLRYPNWMEVCTVTNSNRMVPVDIYLISLKLLIIASKAHPTR